jgi:hypothetical protein
LIKLAPYLKHTLLKKTKVIESFSFCVYSRILKNKIDKIGLTLTMFEEYRDKEMAHSIQSPAVDVFSLPSRKKKKLTTKQIMVNIK